MVLMVVMAVVRVANVIVVGVQYLSVCLVVGMVVVVVFVELGGDWWWWLLGIGGIVVVVMMVTHVLRVEVVIRESLSAFALNPLF